MAAVNTLRLIHNILDLLTASALLYSIHNLTCTVSTPIYTYGDAETNGS